MNITPLPHLNLDAATALALPLAPVEARAEFRLCFRLPDGDEMWLLARLCAIQQDRRKERFNYCIVLRPENAESERVFVTENLCYRDGMRELKDWMTPDAAKKWDWDLFEQSFNDNRYARSLSRFWKAEESAQIMLLKFGADGWGAIYDSMSGNKVERFIWQRKQRDISHEIADLQFLRVQDADFRRKVRALWEEADGSIQTALRWAQLSDEEKSAIAFKCERGSWAQLREVAAWVLTLYVSRSQLSADSCSWVFVDYGYITVNRVLKYGRDEPALQAWRIALTESFGAHNVDAAGVKIDSLPICLSNYINHDELSHITIAPPTMHETMEAQLKLRDWTNEHFAPDEAARLLELLAR